MTQRKKDTESQNTQIIAYLLQGYTLTPLEALQRFRCLRLAARISNLRDDGWEISTTRHGNEYATYKLESKLCLKK